MIAISVSVESRSLEADRGALDANIYRSRVGASIGAKTIRKEKEQRPGTQSSALIYLRSSEHPLSLGSVPHHCSRT